MLSIKISKEASADLDDGYWFYERQDSGLGDYFISNISADIEGLKITAGIHRQMYRDYHRLLCHVFPYAIYYTFVESEAIVWAVIDCRRDPQWILDRLSE
jgi:plasmid stabilization system protein ParE